MKKITGLLAIMIMLTSCTSNKTDFDEIKAIWISYIDYTQMLWGHSQSEFETNVDVMYQDIVDLGLNTVYVHASAFTDAYFESDIYPSQYVSNNIGDNLDFDPLEIMCEKADEYELRIEAWINPLRSFDKDKMSEVPDDFIVKKWVNDDSRNVVWYENRYYLNPYYDEVKDLVSAVVSEILDNYNVDGIHMDDYFYPDMVDESFDSIEFSNSELSLHDFRTNNVNELIKQVNQTIKKHDKHLEFSVSPAGNLEYSKYTIFGDVENWVNNNYVDYIVPQIYFGYTNEARPFLKTLNQWQEVVDGTDVGLVVGLASYKINQPSSATDSDEWNNENDIIARQIIDSKAMNNYMGYSLFSYYSMYHPESEDINAINQQIENIKELNISK